jgi:hypothetical protein
VRHHQGSTGLCPLACGVGWLGGGIAVDCGSRLLAASRAAAAMITAAAARSALCVPVVLASRGLALLGRAEKSAYHRHRCAIAGPSLDRPRSLGRSLVRPHSQVQPHSQLRPQIRPQRLGCRC